MPDVCRPCEHRLPDGPLCRYMTAPTCGGTCLGDGVCGELSDTARCDCVPPDQTCLLGGAPACGGTCPVGETCGVENGNCVCVPG